MTEEQGRYPTLEQYRKNDSCIEQQWLMERKKLIDSDKLLSFQRAGELAAAALLACVLTEYAHLQQAVLHDEIHVDRLDVQYTFTYNENVRADLYDFITEDQAKFRQVLRELSGSTTLTQDARAYSERAIQGKWYFSDEKDS